MRPYPLLICLLAGTLSLFSAKALTVIDSDICVYGGTSGGVISAVQAARMGKSVSLAVFNNHLGGMTSGGLGATDTGNASAIQGMAREFYTRIGQHYGGSSARFNFEPKVAEQVFGTMLTEVGVTPRYNQRLAAVTKSGQRIVQITMEDGTIYRAQMFIDATYEGDLMAMAGVSFTVGRESTATYGESLNGIRASTPSHQFTVNVDPYETPGNPASGLLPFIQPGNGGTPGAGDDRVQAYNYRMCLTNNAANRIAIPAPPGYDESRYELLGRLIDARVAKGDSLSMASFMNVSSMPNSKTDINNNGAFSTDYIGMNHDYPTATYAQRAAMEEEHRNYIQGFFYYLGHSTRVPASVRNQMLSYGFCMDEFQDTGGFPHQLYVREGRRMISDYVMLQQNCQGTRVAEDSVGLGSYTMDSHNCQRVVQNNVTRNEGDVQSGTPQPYPISYRSLVPKLGECENLFVPFALSASHVGFGSIRMEPVFMILSQSAGTAAAFAIDDGVAVQELAYNRLAPQLLADGQMLTWGTTVSGGIVVDNADSGGVTLTGSWVPSTSSAGFFGANYLHDDDALKGTKSVRFTPNLPEAGNYDVYLRWTTNANRATNVPVDVTSTSGTSTFTVNQQNNNGVWVKLTTANFAAGTAGSLLIRNDGTNGYVIADAARWVSLSSAPTATVQIVATDAVASEAGSNTARFTVVRNGETAAPLTVNIGYGGSATAGMDYSGNAASVIIPAGSVSQTITVTPAVDSAPEGNEQIVASIQPGAGYTVADPGTATATLLDRPFDTWRFAHFTQAELENAEVSGANADPDEDGASNLVERAFCGDPKTPGTTAPPVAVVENGRLELTYARAKAALADTSFIGEWTDNIGTAWSTSGVTEEILEDDGTVQLVRTTVLTGGSNQRFLRLRLAIP
jgi:hypothetical protein